MGAGLFVGRAGELARLRGLVRRVAGGAGGAALLMGEQGIGKSALLREVLAGADLAGCRVAWAEADELGRRFPLRLMVECLGEEGLLAVEGGMEAAGDGVRERAGPLRLGDGPQAAGPVLAGDPVLAGAERLLALVEQWCAVSPVIVVAEDLHWADEASLLVWRGLARAMGKLPLLVVGSFRPGPADGQVGLMGRRVAPTGVTMVDVGPLRPEEIDELTRWLLEARPGPRLAELLGWAGGNPLYVQELVSTLLRDDRLRVQEGVAELAGEPVAVRVPVSLAAAIEQRLAALPGQAAMVLGWAAVLGPEFSVTDLSVVTGWSAGKLAGVVEQAVAAGVLAAAGSRLEFRHGLIRQVICEAVPKAARAALHLKAAGALAEAGVAAEQVAAQLVAAQLVAAPEVGADWVWRWLAREVPELAYRAPEAAAQLLHQALAQVPAEDARREVLEAALVTVAFLLMHDDELERVARPLLARTADPDRVAEVSWLLVYALVRAHRLAEAEAVAAEALARQGLREVWAARLRAWQAKILDALEQVDEAVEIGQSMTGSLRVGKCPADHTAGLDRIDRALAVIGEDPHTTNLRLELLANRASALEKLDRPAEVGATVREAVALAERVGAPRLGMICTAAAQHYFEAGQWDDALAALETATALPGPDFILIMLHGLFALIAGHRDVRPIAEKHLTAVRDLAIDSGSQRAVAIWLLLARALTAERVGCPKVAVAVLARCLDPGFRQDMPNLYVLLPTLARLALTTTDTSLTAAAMQAAEDEAGREPLPVKTAAADHCRGLAEGDPARVLAAASYYESTGRPVARAMALEDAAVLLAGHGDLPAARRALNGAARLYHDLGAEWDLRRADARLRRYGVRRGRAGLGERPARGWDALTPAESKVAALVAAGRSNPDIAAELFLSRNTVQTHVSHVLVKLGARSRAEIISQAMGRAGSGSAAD